MMKRSYLVRRKAFQEEGTEHAEAQRQERVRARAQGEVEEVVRGQDPECLINHSVSFALHHLWFPAGGAAAQRGPRLALGPHRKWRESG